MDGAYTIIGLLFGVLFPLYLFVVTRGPRASRSAIENLSLLHYLTGLRAVNRRNMLTKYSLTQVALWLNRRATELYISLKTESSPSLSSMKSTGITVGHDRIPPSTQPSEAEYGPARGP